MTQQWVIVEDANVYGPFGDEDVARAWAVMHNVKGNWYSTLLGSPYEATLTEKYLSERMVEFLLSFGLGSHEDDDDPNYFHERTEATAYWHYKQGWSIRVANGEVWVEWVDEPNTLKMVMAVIGYAHVLGVPLHWKELGE